MNNMIDPNSPELRNAWSALVLGVNRLSPMPLSVRAALNRRLDVLADALWPKPEEVR